MDPWTFGPYEVRSLLGRGGMGEVYEAFDHEHDRTVALKLLVASLAADEGYRARFRRECQLAARLNEPHVIPIHSFGEIDGRLFLDMRLVRGHDLGELLSDYGPPAPARAVSIIGQVARALDAAHDDGLIHRDVKPSNVLVVDDPGAVDDSTFVYLVDFGVARAVSGDTDAPLTQAGGTVGTFEYMPPERFLGADADRRTDVYALGCLLFETLTGRRPFTGKDLPTFMYAHLHRDAPRPSQLGAGVPPELDDVVARGLAKDPEQRFQTAGELAAAARLALRRAGTRPPPSGGLHPSVPPAGHSGVQPGPRSGGQPADVRPPSWPDPRQQGSAGSPPPSHPGFAAAPVLSAGPQAAPFGSSSPDRPGDPTPPPSTPAAFSGAHRPGTPPPPNRASRSNRVLIAAAVVVVVAVVAVSVALIVRSRDGGSTGERVTGGGGTVGPTSTAPTALNSAQSALNAVLPPTYRGQCQGLATPSEQGATSALTCRAPFGNVDGHPVSALFVRYSDVTTLDAAFSDLMNGEGVKANKADCPAVGYRNWENSANTSRVIGQIASYVEASSKQAQITWTTRDDLYLATVTASANTDTAKNGLCEWWRDNS